MRTNIEIDDELMRKAMEATGAPTKKAAVEEALRILVQIKGQSALNELWGTVTWCGPDDDWFAPDPLDPEWVPPARPVAAETSVGSAKLETIAR
jgi:Arc/MetJ family transcription regulator